MSARGIRACSLAFVGGAGGDGELCVAMQMRQPVCQTSQTVEDRLTREESRGVGGGVGQKKRNKNERRGK